jgi:hypothetical protein
MFSFPETELEGEGVWLKCGSCGNLFFQENPDHIEPPSQPSKEDILAEDDAQMNADLEEIRAELSGPYKLGMEPTRGRLFPVLKWAGIAAAMLLAAGVVYFVVFPDVGHNILRQALKYVPFSKELGLTGKDAPMVNTGIDFVNVKEKFVKNWIVGDIMVIQGTAVNKSSKPVSLLKIKARLLDQSGQFIAESSSYAGDIFTEEEILNLTEQEILAKLAFSGGSEYPNRDIAPDASIPFLIVFIKPPPKASEYIVELDNMESPK